MIVLKKYTILSTVKREARLAPSLRAWLFLHSYKALAKKLLRKTKSECVVYGVIYEKDGGKPSCHLFEPRPFTKAYLRQCYPRTGSMGRPLVIYGK